MTKENPTSPGPMLPNQRIQSLDMVRGFALLGILFIHISSFSAPVTMFMGLSQNNVPLSDYLFEIFTLFLVKGKSHALFNMLFGAGIYLMCSNIEKRGGKPLYRSTIRMAGLILLGLVHIFFLIDFEILVLYGAGGLFAYFFRNLSPRKLLILGVIFYMVPAIYTTIEVSKRTFDQQTLVSIHNNLQVKPDQVAKEIKDFKQRDWLESAAKRIKSQKMKFFSKYLIRIVITTMALMLIGMALFKWGFFSGGLSQRSYIKILLYLLPIGLLLILIKWAIYSLHDWNLMIIFKYNASFIQRLGSLLSAFLNRVTLSLSYCIILILIYKRGLFKILTNSLAAVGRMALTNYFMQSIICTTLFNGYGFGLYGQFGRSGQFLIVLIILAFQMWYSPLWLKHFRFGPLEWLWRSMTYWKLQPMKLKKETG